MSAGKVAASSVSARVRHGSTAAAAVVARGASRRRPRLLSTVAAAIGSTIEMDAYNGINSSRSSIEDGSRSSSSSGGQLGDLLSLTLARSVHEGEERVVVGPRRALPWTNRISTGSSSRMFGTDFGVAIADAQARPSASAKESSQMSRRDGYVGEDIAAKVARAAAAVVSDGPTGRLLRRSPSGGGGVGGIRSTGSASGTDGGGLAAVSDDGDGAGLLRGGGTTGKEKAAFEGSRWLQKRLGLSEQQSAKIVLAAPLSFQCEGGPSGKSPSPFSSFGSSGKATAPQSLLDVSALDVRLRWLKVRLGLDKQGVRKVVRGFPRIFATSVEADLEPRLAWLKTGLRLEPTAIRKLVVSFPTLFSKSVEDGLETKLSWLEKRLSLSRGELSKMVVKYPTLLSYSVEDNLEPRIRWLEERLGLDDVAVRKMVLQFPAVFGYSIEDNLEPKLSWLQSELALDLFGSQRLVRLAPPILGASIDDNLRHKLPRLQELLGMSRESVVAVLIRKPALLALDADNNIEPKVRFFMDEMGASRGDIRSALEANSSLLMYSLDKRWRPRAEHMRSFKVEPLFSAHWRPMATRDEQSFRGWLEQVSPRR